MPVDLDAAYGQVEQRGERGIPRAEIIQRHRGAQYPKPLQRGQALRVIQWKGLRHLQPQRAGGQIVGIQQCLDVRHQQRVVQLRPAEVDRHLEPQHGRDRDLSPPSRHL